MTDQDFIAFVKKECKHYWVKLSLRDSTYCRYDGMTLSGGFDDGNRVLVCAKRADGFVGILAHEYCHMMQWAEKYPLWVKCAEERSYEAWNKHLSGEKVDMDAHFENMRDLELDNEKRTVALIKKLKLDIDIEFYTKRANAYVMFYNYMKITGLWAKPGNTPYSNEKIIAAMPSKFSMNYSKLPKKIEKIFREEGIGER